LNKKKSFEALESIFEALESIFEALESIFEALESIFDALESIFEVELVFFSVFRFGLAGNEEVAGVVWPEMMIHHRR
jgi:hypothetical protein